MTDMLREDEGENFTFKLNVSPAGSLMNFGRKLTESNDAEKQNRC